MKECVMCVKVFLFAHLVDLTVVNNIDFVLLYYITFVFILLFFISNSRNSLIIISLFIIHILIVNLRT